MTKVSRAIYKYSYVSMDECMDPSMDPSIEKYEYIYTYVYIYVSRVTLVIRCRSVVLALSSMH